jgi:hypothetical protein
MAEYQLHQAPEAQAALAAAAKIMAEEMDLSVRIGSRRGQQGAAVALMQKEGPKLEGGELTGGWREWLIANSLMKEAEALIQPQTSSH